MTSSDKDFRFMATNDLMSELQKDSIKLDDDCEKKVVRMLLKLLEDKNGEVQNLAVKWFDSHLIPFYVFYFEWNPFNQVLISFKVICIWFASKCLQFNNMLE